MIKITIIGGAGFVGTFFCKILNKKKISFEILDLKKSKSFPSRSKVADVRDKDSLRKHISGDLVVNLAAIHRDDVKDINEYFRTNVQGAENVCAVCSEKKIKKIIFTSSVAVYGFAEGKINETGRINPLNEYGRTKFLAEEIFRKWHLKDDNLLTIIRPTVIFGEGNRGNVFNLFDQIANGFFIMIGDGKNKKSMAYVKNVASFLEALLASKKKYALYNYVDEPDFSMNKLVKLVRDELSKNCFLNLKIPVWLGLILGRMADLFSHLSGRRLPISQIRVQKFVSTTVFASRKSDVKGFSPPYSLQEAVSLTIKNEFICPDPNREIFFTE